MEIGFDEAKSLKLAVRMLKESPDGQLLLEFLEDRAGHFAPAYDPTNPTTIILASGRQEMVMVLRNLDRLTADQIVDLLEGQ